LLKVNPAVRERQAARLNEIRGARDSGAVETALAALKRCAEGTDNVMIPILDAVKKRATLGEICDTLRGVYGEYTHGARC
jgi:methylmalonyl-CoA mutase N-terminal domain/subunit